MPSDNDIDSLADVSGNHIKIVPYPGPLDFSIWCESQFPHVIPQGTHNSLVSLTLCVKQMYTIEST